jgi:mono/diheme cytochrome c family protein
MTTPGACALALALAALAGCAGRTSRQPPLEVFPDMDRQPKYKAQAAGRFFADGRADRGPVPGTVAQGQLKEDAGFHAGIRDGMYLGLNPLPIDTALLARGQERYNIYCAPCHDRTGSGQGLVGKKSMWLANNLLDDRVRKLADGDLFDAITHGRRTMPAYRFQMAERDRWAVVAYVRALQRAAAGTVEDVPADLRSELR